MSDLFPIPENVPYIGGVYAHYKNTNKEYLVTGIFLNYDADEWHLYYVLFY